MRAWIATIVLSLAPVGVWACWNSSSTCTNGTGTAGEGCKSPGATPKVCFIETSAGCYYIYNSTGKDLWIPTKTAAEFNQFVSTHPGTVTVGTGVRGSTCFPSCYMNSTGCPGVPNSATNPP